MSAKTNYVANVLGEGLIEEDLPVDRAYPVPLRVGDEGVLVLYGGLDGVTLVVAADGLDDAERRIAATFADATVDDLDESVDQRPLSVAYTEGRVPDAVHHLLLLDHRIRPYLTGRRDEVEALIGGMPEATQAEYRRTSEPHRALRALDEALAYALRDAT